MPHRVSKARVRPKGQGDDAVNYGVNGHKKSSRIVPPCCEIGSTVTFPDRVNRLGDAIACKHIRSYVPLPKGPARCPLL